MTHLMLHVSTPVGPVVVEGDIEDRFDCEFAHGRLNVNAVASCVRLTYPGNGLSDDDIAATLPRGVRWLRAPEHTDTQQQGDIK